MTLFTPARLVYCKMNKNVLNIHDDTSISNCKINDKIINLLSPIKKISSKVTFFTSKTSLAFI